MSVEGNFPNLQNISKPGKFPLGIPFDHVSVEGNFPNLQKMSKSAKFPLVIPCDHVSVGIPKFTKIFKIREIPVGKPLRSRDQNVYHVYIVRKPSKQYPDLRNSRLKCNYTITARQSDHTRIIYLIITQCLTAM